MADVSIDSLQIQIESDSSKAEQSIRRLATSLTNLGTALNEVGRHERSVRWVTGSLASLNGLKFDGLKTAITRLRSLSQIDFKKNGTGLNAGAISEALVKISDAAQKLNGVNVKSTGINTLINSVTRLSEQGMNAQRAGDAIREMTNALTGMQQLQGIGENAQGAAKVVSTFTRLTNNMGKTDFANNIPKATEAIKGFITEMAQMPDVSDSTVRMAEALAQMAKSGAKAGSALQETSHVVRSGASSYQVAEVIVNSYAEAWKTVFRLLKQIPSITLKAIKGSLSALKQLGSAGVSKLKEFASSLRNIKRESSGISNVTMNLRNLLRIALGFRGIYGVFNFLKESVTAGADVAEVNHIVEETFGDMSEELKGWASTAIDKYGIAETAAKRYAGTMSAMFQASGTAQKDASKMATDLVGLAGDLSSFFNIDTETAYNKIKSGMAGMVRPLRDLGIDLTATTLKEYALAQGITKSYAAMTQAEKVMLRYQYLMDVTKKQQGDFAATSNSMANAMRRLRAYVDSVKDALGQGLVAALRHVVSALNVVLRTVLRAANAFRVFMETLFGKNTSGGGIAIDTSDIEEISDDLSGADESASGTADGLDDAADSAKKLKKELSVLPFDELNQLSKAQEKESKTTGTGGGAGVLDGLIDTGTFDGIIDQMVDEFRGNELPDAISEWAERIKKAFTEHRWEDLGKEIAWGINQGIDYLYKLFDPAEADAKLNPWIDAFTTTLNSMLDDIHWYELGETFANGLNILLDKANRFFDETDWNLLGTSLAEWANGLVDNIDPVELGQFFANKLNMLWETAEGFVTEFHWDQLGTQLGLTAWELVSNINYDAMINTITTGLKGISSTVWNFAKTFPWVEAGKLWAEKANKFIEKLPTEEIGRAVGKLTSGIIATLNQLFDPQKGIDFKRLGVKFAIGVYSIIYEVPPEALGRLISNIFNGAIDFFIGTFEELSTKAEDIGKRLGTFFRTAINNVHAKELGNLLAIIWDTAWSILKNAISQLGSTKNGGKGTGLGEIIHDTILGIVEKIDFKDATDTFKTFVGKVAEDITEAFGDTAAWENLGSKIGQAIVDILKDDELPTKLAEAINSVVDALLALISGAVDELITHQGEIVEKFKEFIRGLDWLDIAKVAGAVFGLKLATSFKDMALNAAKNVLQYRLEAMISGAFGSANITNSVVGFQTTLNTCAGALLAEGGLYIALTKIIEKVGQLSDALHGGNAELTPSGGAIDGIIDQLAEDGKILDDTHTKLFTIKEDLETAGVKGEELGNKMGKAMTDAGVPIEDVTSAINYLKGNCVLTKEQFEVLDGVLTTMNENVGKSKSVFDEFGINTNEAFKTVESSLVELAQKTGTEWSGETGVLAKMQQAMGDYSNNAQLAIQTVAKEFIDAGGNVDTLRTLIDTKLNAPGLFDALISATQTESTELDTAAQRAEQFAEKSAKANKNTKDYNESANKTNPILEGLKTIFSGLVGFFKEKTPTAEQTAEMWKGFTETTETVINTLKDTMDTKSEEIGKSLPDGAAQGIEDEMSVFDEAVKGMAVKGIEGFREYNESHSPSRKYAEIAESIPEGVAEGINNRLSEATSAIENLVSSMTTSFSTELSNMKSTLGSDGEDAMSELMDSMQNGVNNEAYKIKDALSNAISDMIDASNDKYWDIYEAGQSVAKAFADGLKSQNLPTLHTEWHRIDYGDQNMGYWWVEMPDFHWYKKGGLFTKATIAGFGEDGDEAALPLENKRTMGRIANAITDNMGAGYGVSKDDIISAIVQAEMMNSGNKQPVIINAELRTENNETLARAVIDGMNSIDYRNNATPQFGY